MFQTQKQKADGRGACYLTNSLPAEVGCVVGNPDELEDGSSDSAGECFGYLLGVGILGGTIQSSLQETTKQPLCCHGPQPRIPLFSLWLEASGCLSRGKQLAKEQRLMFGVFSLARCLTS